MAISRHGIVQDTERYERSLSLLLTFDYPDKPFLSLLFDLPREMVLAIPTIAPETEATKIMAKLANTGKTLYTFFQSELKKRAAAQLARYIEDADQIHAEAMIKANPRLLFVSVDEVVNKHTKQIIKNVKPLQLAYCEGDDEMCLMLTPYFELACGSVEAGREEIRKQLKEKFVEGSDEQEEGKKIRKNCLDAVIQAITNEQFNNGRDAATNTLILSEATQIAIATFREAFAASQPKIIHSGMRFRLEILQEVYEVYAQEVAQWDYDDNKCALLEDAVLSFVLRYVSANDVQRFSQGLYYLQDKGEKFKRVNTTRDEHNFYLAVCGASADFHLSGSCLGIVFGCFRRGGRVRRAAGWIR